MTGFSNPATYKRGQAIRMEPERAYMIESGTALTFRTSGNIKSHKQFADGVLTAGCLLDPAAYLNHSPSMRVIIPAETCVVTSAARNDVSSFIHLESISQITRHADYLSTMHTVSHMLVQDRQIWLMRYLAKLNAGHQESGGVRIPLSRLNYAALLNCSREMAGRGLKQLEASGDISISTQHRHAVLLT